LTHRSDSASTMQRPGRPLGVTILAILQILIGIVGLLVSLAVIGLAALASTIPSFGTLLGAIGLVIGGIALFFSIIWLATGFGFIHGRGWAWTLGMIFSVLSLLGAIGALALGLITGGVGGLVFWGLMLYYLTRNHVKRFFGKGVYPGATSYPLAYSPVPGIGRPQMVTNIPSYTPLPSNSPAVSTTQTTGASTSPATSNASPSASQSSGAVQKALASCPYCGSKLTMGSPKCLTCGATI
ncbi:hypothetical protein J2P12_02335, partial [Candidatus Bathyarchaeota archaeon]|nr:hypothetical protein [Candidatus Bathyarchaeota archaeon]